MIRLVLIFFMTGIVWSGSAQVNAEVFSEQKGASFIYFVRNSEVIPVTVELNLKLTGMKSDFGGEFGRFVVPAGEDKYQIAKLTAKPRARSIGVSGENIIYLGDETLESYDKEYVYTLPFEHGKTFKIYQGYDGKFSHQGQNALDFSLDIGDKVIAARGGIVTDIVEHNSSHCASSKCKDQNNYITIYHEDGTFAEYTHLDLKGALVEIGDHVEVGQHIGQSGNTGWSSGPHLHFIVYKYKKGKRKTLRTKFDLGEGKSSFLQEGKSYTRI